MKKYITLMIILLSSVFVYSQTSDIERGRAEKIELDQFFGNIKIEGTSSDRIVIERIKYNQVSAALVKQLKTYGYKKSDLDDIHLNRFGQKMTLSPSNIKSQFADYIIRVPKDMIIEIKSDITALKSSKETPVKQNNIEMSNIENEIDIISYSSTINLTDITGPFTCSLYKGKFEASFNSLKPETESAVSVFNGDVVIHLNKDISCNVGLSDKAEEINSDFKITDGKINGGGSSSINISVFKGSISILKIK